MNSKEIKNKISKDIKNRMKELTVILPEDRTGDDYEELLDLFWLVDDCQQSEYLPYLFDYLIVDEQYEVEGISETLTNMVEDCPVEALLPCTLNNLYRYDINPEAFQGIFLKFVYNPKDIEFIKKYLKENINNFDKETLLKLLEDVKTTWNLKDPQLNVIRDLRKILTSGDNK